MTKKKRVISVTAVILAIAAVITYINFPKKDKTVSAVQSVDELYEKIVYKKSESNYDAYLKDNSTLKTQNHFFSREGLYGGRYLHRSI